MENFLGINNFVKEFKWIIMLCNLIVDVDENGALELMGWFSF